MKNLTGFLSISYQLVTHIYENIPEPWDKQWPLWEMESKLHWIHKEKTLSPTHKCFQTERERRGQGNTQNDNMTQSREYENMTEIFRAPGRCHVHIGWWRNVCTIEYRDLILIIFIACLNVGRECRNTKCVVTPLV